jgi:hypothetical protein
VLDEGESGCRHGCERDERRTPPGLHPMGAGLGVPRDNDLLGCPAALEREACCVRPIETGGDVMSDRVVEVVPELGTQPLDSCTANLRSNGGEIRVDVIHWFSTACTPAANRSQSSRRPSRAFRPRAVRS